MKSNRLDRQAAYDNFRDSSKELFTSLSSSDSSSRRLDELYSLCICPGGRAGGLNKKVVEVFYGNRPIDSSTQIEPDAGIINKLELAHGATLAYFRTDDGHVICNLYPAASENQKPQEDAVLFDYVDNPARLKQRSSSHWKTLVAYMEATCIDGQPNLGQHARVFYLRNFKRYVVESKVQDRKALVLTKNIFKWAFTVGLSGIFILIASLFMSRKQGQEEFAHHREVMNISIASTKELSKISNQIKVITEKLNEVENLADKATKMLSTASDNSDSPKTREKGRKSR